MTDRDEWLQWRRQGIGASDVAGILGLSKWSSPWSVWVDKVGLVPDHEQSERQRIGLILEGAIGLLFHGRTGLYVVGEQTRCEHPEMEWARCTVDGFVFDAPPGPEWPGIDQREGALGIFEAKTDGAFRWPDGIPMAYQCQAHWQMFVTEAERVWFAVLHSGFNFDVYEMQRDDAEINYIVTEVDHFWHEYVLAGNPPPVDGSSATADALQQVWPEHIDETVADITELREMWEARRKAKDEIRRLQREVAVYDNEVKAAIGDAECGVMDGEVVCSWRLTKRAEHEVPAWQGRILRTVGTKAKRA